MMAVDFGGMVFPKMSLVCHIFTNFSSKIADLPKHYFVPVFVIYLSGRCGFLGYCK